MKRFKVTKHKLQRARGRRMLGYKFRRQQVIHGLIVDFFCAELNLVLEIDGPLHAEAGRSDYDQSRTTYLESQGFHVRRLTNDEVTEERRHQLLCAVTSSPPLPTGEGDRG